MFFHAKRSIYSKNQLLEVMCQYRFLPILRVETEVPSDFQEALREDYPRYSCRKDQQPPKMQMLAGQIPRLEQSAPTNNHCFSSEDGLWRVNLTKDYLTLTAGRYTIWEEFARRLDKVLYQFIQVYRPACFQRVGLRYINAVSRTALELEQTPWRELIEEKYLGFMDDETIPETAFGRCTQDVEMALPGGCRLKLHTGPGLVHRGVVAGDREVKFVLDIDVSVNGNLPVNKAVEALNTLHVHAWSVFRGAITDTLHDAMGPKEG